MQSCSEKIQTNRQQLSVHVNGTVMATGGVEELELR